jgi:hypothetical protein
MDWRDVLARSRAAEQFKRDVRALAEAPFGVRRGYPTIECSRPAPGVKVLRVITQLLAAEPDFPVERVRVDGWSGCSDFVGMLVATGQGVARRFEFVWDCRWRAQQEGWRDVFGDPDQSRAALHFGWRCFAAWRERAVGAPAVAG